ncbi:MAG: hypothetical protein Q8Q09_20510 [Deltaproteobacteria bacterium]|nr:hypothetical protein [Deltaproteobacteria bacterium]
MSTSVDPEMARAAIADAVQTFPSMAEFASRATLRFLPLPGGGGAFMLRYDPPLQVKLADAWEFQNAVVRGYKQRVGEGAPPSPCQP